MCKNISPTATIKEKKLREKSTKLFRYKLNYKEFSLKIKLARRKDVGGKVLSRYFVFVSHFDNCHRRSWIICARVFTSNTVLVPLGIFRKIYSCFQCRTHIHLYICGWCVALCMTTKTDRFSNICSSTCPIITKPLHSLVLRLQWFKHRFEFGAFVHHHHRHRQVHCALHNIKCKITLENQIQNQKKNQVQKVSIFNQRNGKTYLTSVIKLAKKNKSRKSKKNRKKR